MNDLINLSSDARWLLSQINYLVDGWHTQPLDKDEAGDTVLARLRGLAESLVALMDSGEFEDVKYTVYDLRINPDTGDLRDLSAMLRATDDEIERAEAEADAIAAGENVDDEDGARPC